MEVKINIQREVLEDQVRNIIADNPNMSFQDKQRSVADIVNEYATSLKYLEEIIKKNLDLPELQ